MCLHWWHFSLIIIDNYPSWRLLCGIVQIIVLLESYYAAPSRASFSRWAQRTGPQQDNIPPSNHPIIWEIWCLLCHLQSDLRKFGAKKHEKTFRWQNGNGRRKAVRWQNIFYYLHVILLVKHSLRFSSLHGCPMEIPWCVVTFSWWEGRLLRSLHFLSEDVCFSWI